MAARIIITGSTAPSSLPPLIRALMDPACHPDPQAAAPVDLVQTHISWVLLAGEYAYKIKKPVALGFLDFSSLDQRRHFCEEELRLNRRTAPQLYLDVTPITGTETAPVLGGSGRPIEYALRMRRFPQTALLEQLARRGELSAAMVDRLVRAIATFHDAIAVSTAGDDHGSPQKIADQVRDNFAHIGRLAVPAEAQGVLQRLRAWTEAGSVRLATAFASRKTAGMVRECHGDLHLGNIAVLDGQPVLFDCIEFNAEFRWIDVISEIAFLVMDLLDRGFGPLAWRCLNRYLEITGDYAGVRVLRHYLAYRVMVRAKVALIRASQNTPDDVRREAEADFRHHLRLCETLVTPARKPVLILMHGLSGSGKTTVSQGLLEGMGAVRLRSDVERKRLHGLGEGQHSHSPVGGGLYDASASRRTYERLAALARLILGEGWSVIVDAASLQRNERDAMRRIARELALPFLIVSCAAGDSILRQRLAWRATEGTDASEAGAAVLDRQCEVQQPLAPDEAGEVITAAESADVNGVVARVLACLDQ